MVQMHMEPGNREVVVMVQLGKPLGEGASRDHRRSRARREKARCRATAF